jgi:hypothetical protein
MRRQSEGLLGFKNYEERGLSESLVAPSRLAMGLGLEGLEDVLRRGHALNGGVWTRKV